MATPLNSAPFNGCSPQQRTDFWGSLPISLAAYAHMAGEALVPAFPKLLVGWEALSRDSR